VAASALDEIRKSRRDNFSMAAPPLSRAFILLEQSCGG
jgi:hypothetical protein